jgi:hypothetical protein
MILRLATPTANDIDGFFALQAKYLLANIAPEHRASGFVTTPFTLAQLEYMMAEKNLFIAEDQGKVVAYCFGGAWDFYHQWVIFEYMTTLFPTLYFEGELLRVENSFQYGPICIEEAYRGTKLLTDLFESMRSGLAARFDIGITFINQANQRSFEAHTRKLGLTLVGAFQYNQNDYHILAFKTN